MPHETTLIATIVIELVWLSWRFLASKLRLPPLVGYLLAGVAVGPFTPGFVADEALATQLAEIGVILLMFGVGLHFSIKDLLAVRNIAIPGAVGQIVAATMMGVGVSYFWGWPFGAGLVFGLALSVASTVVLLRALEERNILDSNNGRIAVGWLIVEDLAMVLALVLLPALAGVLGGDPQSLAGHMGGDSLLLTLALTLGKVALFLVLVLVVGAPAIPWLLAQVARTGSRELFTLSVLATALEIAFGSAELFGVSFALGAFFAGVVLSESDFSHQAAADSLPLLSKAASVAFVSLHAGAAPKDEGEWLIPQALAWLRRHGIEASATQHLAVGGFGDALLSLAVQKEAGLIVMGGYGHTRMREWVLGGATRAVLERMDVPVLMAH